MSLWIERAAAEARRRGLQARAEQLLQAAQAGEGCGEFTLLVTEGTVFISTSSDWPLERLIAERGAEAGWRIRRRGSGVFVEGRAGTARVRMASTCSELSPVPLPSGTVRILPAAWD